MRNPYDVLREKETDLLRVQNETEALRLVLPLLEDGAEVCLEICTRSSASVRQINSRQPDES
jgi:hypothetical protein